MWHKIFYFRYTVARLAQAFVISRDDRKQETIQNTETMARGMEKIDAKRS